MMLREGRFHGTLFRVTDACEMLMSRKKVRSHCVGGELERRLESARDLSL